MLCILIRSPVFQASNTSREATEEGRRLSEVIFILKTGFLRITEFTVLLGTRRIDRRTTPINDDIRSRIP